MAVHVHGEGRRSVAQSILDYSGMDTGAYEAGGMSMTEIVEPDAWVPSLTGQFREVVAKTRRIESLAIRPGEHQAVILVDVAQLHLVKHLAPLIGSQEFHRGRV